MLENWKNKLKQQLDEEAARLKKQLEKTQAEVRNAAGQKLTDLGVLNTYLPELRGLIEQKVLPLLHVRTLTRSMGSTHAEAAFRMAYALLPAPVRLLITEETFVQFCMSHRSSLLHPATEQQIAALPAAAPSRSAVEELLQLKQLLDTGLLTEAEFESFKQQLLAAS